VQPESDLSTVGIKMKFAFQRAFRYDRFVEDSVTEGPTVKGVRTPMMNIATLHIVRGERACS